VSLPAVPAMVEALATNLSRGQQIVGIFMFGMAFGQIPAGLVSDRIGRLPVLYAGMALFLAGAIAAAMADSIEVMLAGRFIQGIGSAPALVMSRAIVRDIASGKAAAKLMSIMTMIFTAAPVIAPTIGALLVAQWGWRAPFIMIVGLGVLITIGIRLYIVETHTPEPGQHPVRQLVSSFREFFSHSQSIFGLLLIVLPPAGFLSIIAVSAALVVEIYGFSITQFGLVFATAGISILVGSLINRLLITRFDSLQVIAIGVVLYGHRARPAAKNRRCRVVDHRHAAERPGRFGRAAQRRDLQRQRPQCRRHHGSRGPARRAGLPRQAINLPNRRSPS
jgi:DHA1 family bicyclomycin/chloramphenicol resistance-like MFS transporter